MVLWSLEWKGRPYSIACEVIWPETLLIIFMEISYIDCEYDPSGNGHEISCHDCSYLWCYSKHARDIWENAAESCILILCLIEVDCCQFKQLLWGTKYYVNWGVSMVVLTVVKSILYCIVLKGWSLLPNALRPFQIYCAPLNLGIRMWICRLNFVQRPIFSGWKNPSTSARFEPTLDLEASRLPRDHQGRL